MPPLGADNTRRYAIIEPERIAYRHNPFPHFELFTIPQVRRRSTFVAVNFYDRDVGLRILSQNFCLKFPFFRELDDNFLGVVNHVGIRNNGTVGSNNKTRAKTPLLLLRSARWRPLTKKLFQ